MRLSLRWFSINTVVPVLEQGAALCLGKYFLSRQSRLEKLSSQHPRDRGRTAGRVQSCTFSPRGSSHPEDVKIPQGPTECPTRFADGKNLWGVCNDTAVNQSLIVDLLRREICGSRGARKDRFENSRIGCSGSSQAFGAEDVRS